MAPSIQPPSYKRVFLFLFHRFFYQVAGIWVPFITLSRFFYQGTIYLKCLSKGYWYCAGLRLGLFGIFFNFAIYYSRAHNLAIITPENIPIGIASRPAIQPDETNVITTAIIIIIARIFRSEGC